MKKTNTFPLEEIDKEFARFERMSQDPFATDTEIRNDIISLFEKAVYFRTPYRLSPTLVFRARGLDVNVDTLEKAEQKLDRIRELSYPYEEVLSRIPLGRCNKPREAVFYASNENGVPVFEIRPKVGRYVVLSSFRSQTNNPVKIQAPMVGVKQIRDNLIRTGRAVKWAELLAGDSVYVTEHADLIRIDDLLSEWFMKSVDDTNRFYYRLTTIVYKIMTENTLYGGKVLMDGLIYPSVASEATGVNFAMKTKFVDDNYKFFGAGIYYYERLNNNRMELRWLKQAWGHEVVDGDKLVWGPHNSERDLFVLGTDLNPEEFPQFNPDEYAAQIKVGTRLR